MTFSTFSFPARKRAANLVFRKEMVHVVWNQGKREQDADRKVEGHEDRI